MKKIITLILIFALTSSLLISCGKGSYKDDVSLDTISQKIESLVSVDGGYTKLSEDYLQFYFELPAEVTEKVVVQSSKSEDITEFGIFKADKKNIDELEDAIEDYIDEQEDVLVPQVNMYAPEQAPKIENASVKVFGNYVVYLVMEKDDQRAVYDAIEALLKK